MRGVAQRVRGGREQGAAGGGSAVTGTIRSQERLSLVMT